MTPNPRVGGKNPEEERPLLKQKAILDKQFEDYRGDGGVDGKNDPLQVATLNDFQDHEVTFPVTKPELQVYLRRWWVLGVFSLLAFMQAFVWITFSTISASAKEVFGWTDSTIALLIDWGNIPFIIFVVPLCWLLDNKGLRVSTLLAAFLTVLGTGLRCISSNTTIATPLIHVGHLLNGVAGIVVTGAPAQLSSVWFPAHERTTATSLSVLTNYLGIAFGYLIGPILVPHPDIPVCNNSSLYEPHPCNTTTMTADIIEEERFKIMDLMYYECAASCILFLAALVYFPDRPPLPPSPSATQERLKVTTTLSQLLKNRNFWIIGMGYACTNAVTGSWLGVLGPALEPFGITQAQTGIMGMVCTLVGAVLSLVLARFVDYLGGKIKLCLILLLCVGLVSFVWYALLYYEVVEPTLGLIYPSVMMAGIVAYTGTPLYMEMSVEVAYPIQEGVVGTVLQAIMNLMGAFFLALFLIPNIGVGWMTWALIGTTVMGVVLACLQSETYHRSDLDRQNSQINYEAINSDGLDV